MESLNVDEDINRTWEYINEPPKKEIAWCYIRRTGWPREKVVVSFCSTSDQALLKNTIEKHSYIPVKMGGSTVQLQNVITGVYLG